MKQEKKKYEKPVVLKEERYQTANPSHCTQVNECDPNYAK